MLKAKKTYKGESNNSRVKEFSDGLPAGEARLKSVLVRLNELEDTMLDLSTQISIMKNTLAKTQARITTSQVLEKNFKKTPEQELVKMMFGKRAKVVDITDMVKEQVGGNGIHGGSTNEKQHY